MRLLAIDVGSSSAKVAVFSGGRLRTPPVYARFPTSFDGTRAEVDGHAVLAAVQSAVRDLHPGQHNVDLIALSTMAPSWVAMDRRGRPLTPLITHQDRRSVPEARDLEKRLGPKRHLRLAGNRPFPGGISSTTWAWFARHAPSVLRRADLVGHLSTFLHRHLTAARVTDPSNASFMGIYTTLTLQGWSDELCAAVGADPRLLPEIRQASEIAGRLTRPAADRLGLPHGTPVLAGIMDGSCAMLLAGARPGQLVDTSGSTDVLALCTDRPVPHPQVLTRALGVGRKWLAVSTVAAFGSALDWARRTFFSECDWPAFLRIVRQVQRRPGSPNAPTFEPYLAGDRMSIDQRQGTFANLTLATTRDDLLRALLDALAAASGRRIAHLRAAGTPIRPDVLLSGGVARELQSVLRRDWPRHWRYRLANEATLRGLARLPDM